MISDEEGQAAAIISCFQYSCSRFAPLIFDLETSCGFKDLMETCKPLWNAVDADPDLPNKLVKWIIVKIAVFLY